MRLLFMVLLAIAAGGCRTSSVDFGSAARPPAGLSLEVLAVEQGAREATLRLINTTNTAFAFRGYSSEKPDILHQVSVGVGWITRFTNDCGTGITEVRLAPGDTSQFRVPLPPLTTLPRGRLRIGVAEASGRFIVWSPAVDLPSETWAARNGV